MKSSAPEEILVLITKTKFLCMSDVLQFAYWAMWEALPLWPSVVCEFFDYLFQRFSESCARYHLLYYYKLQQIASLYYYLLFSKDRE